MLTYNVFLRAPAWVFRDGHDERVAGMPALLAGYDVVVLEEAFSNEHRDRLREWLRPAYGYASAVLGRDRTFTEDGGVVVLSRWPIGYEDQMVFGDTCAGLDCLADKGVVYIRIDKAGRVYHLFAMHLQDGLEHRDVRERQLHRAREFVDQQQIPAGEPVLLVGDLNVDGIGDPEGYAAMLEILGAVHLTPTPGPLPSWDGELNPLVGSSSRELLDYVLWSRDHQAPVRGFTRVLPLRVNDRDLSDHFAVYGHLEMPPG